MAPPSIVSIERFLLVTFHQELDDADTEALQVEVGTRVVAHAARGVVLDLSGLSVIDSYTGRVIAGLVQATGLLGAPAIVVNMRPEVAITLVELGMALPGVPTARNVDLALALLRERSGRTS
ncbi:RsbS, negative regulator of sigma-B [Rhodovastum atsumiense]|uniref:STAS domain-containing protein n=1 Tax=Rhodovastum atsumiense TaxID=504468 RepID=A0A5M6J137_9PROT|nr:STAS domain-containing protein [Rhodovastum atsumiense]KAA5613919.1 STAS domain-containing protein [Rhodovastum atsumiense]CAH2602052.1 RsbS, negative regulator of sigma-B [Rhodovastum atsumiense]